jgi:hypothetical protein
MRGRSLLLRRPRLCRPSPLRRLRPRLRRVPLLRLPLRRLRPRLRRVPLLRLPLLRLRRLPLRRLPLRRRSWAARAHCPAPMTVSTCVSHWGAEGEQPVGPGRSIPADRLFSTRPLAARSQST